MWAQRAACIAAVTVAAALLCAGGVRGYDFVPITSLYYAGASTGSVSNDRGTCLEKGGYLATEATAVLHNADIAAIQNAIGTTATFYAFLGGGINLQRTNTGGVDGFCPWIASDPDVPTYIDGPYSGLSAYCQWRWRVGRWQLMTSDTGVIADEAHAGIAFYNGSNTLRGSVYGFPNFFFQTTGYITRPGVLLGRNLVLFQNAETTAAGVGPRWTDNYASGGYTYAGGVNFATATSAATTQYFHTVCQNQGPFRLNYENPNASTPQKSDLQYVWWVIFFVILFVLCLIAFLIIACCQEREDMDEPPEDAPEWAEKETEERNVSKRYVSQRSFHQSQRESDERGSSSGERTESESHDSSSSVSKEEHYEEEESFH